MLSMKKIALLTSISFLAIAINPSNSWAQKRTYDQYKESCKKVMAILSNKGLEKCVRDRIRVDEQLVNSGRLDPSMTDREYKITMGIRDEARSTATAQVIKETLENDDPRALILDYAKDSIYYKEGELIYNCAGSRDALGCARNMQAYAEDTVTSDWRYQSGRLVYKCQPYKTNGKTKKPTDLVNDCDDGLAGLVNSLASSYEVRAAVVANNHFGHYVPAQYSRDILYKCTMSKKPDTCALGVFNDKIEGISHDLKNLDRLRKKAEREALNGVNNANREIFKAAREAESKVNDIGNKALGGINKGAGKMKKAGKELGRKLRIR